VDPISQTLLGAVTAQATVGRRLGRWAALFGAVGGELPDLDVLLPADPAMPMEYHRHFTHAIAFIPVGGVLAALPFMLVPAFRRQWKLVLAATTIGCATHGFVDMCTTYGTYWLWPLVDRRLAWDVISIIDPVFTLVLLLGMMWSLIGGSARGATVALSLALSWIGVGVVQHHRAASVQRRIAESRGHQIERGRVMPTLGNLVVWRSLYESGGVLYADAVRVGRSAGVRIGTSVPVTPQVDVRFRAFADGYVARVPGPPPTIYGDMRYSLSPEGFVPLWGIAVTDDGVAWVYPSAEIMAERRALLDDLAHDVFKGDGFEPPP
jgi:inner membrane protein